MTFLERTTTTAIGLAAAAMLLDGPAIKPGVFGAHLFGRGRRQVLVGRRGSAVRGRDRSQDFAKPHLVLRANR